MTHKADWGRFLRERHLLILEWVAEGQSYEEICRKLSMDPVQVQLISMTPGPRSEQDRYDLDVYPPDDEDFEPPTVNNEVV